MVKTGDLEEALSLIARKAPELRDAGVASFAIGDIEVELQPKDPPPAVTRSSDGDNDETDPEKDPATYGGVMPKRRGHDYVMEGSGARRE